MRIHLAYGRNGLDLDLPDHGQYAALRARAGSPQAVLDMISQPGFSAHDQWQVQIQAQIQLKAEVHVYSGGLSDEQIQRSLFFPCRSIEDTVARLLARSGPAASLSVMPNGPMTIPFVRPTARNLI